MLTVMPGSRVVEVRYVEQSMRHSQHIVLHCLLCKFITTGQDLA